MTHALFACVFVIATCGLVYELIAGTLASYLLGDSVFQFSTIIGAYLFSMGIGSYLSRYIRRGLIQRFVEIEILVGLIGGFSAAGLMLAYSYNLPFRMCLYPLVGVIGILAGLEIPLLIRILRDRIELSTLVSQVLTLDYVGALAASLLFPLILVPKLGLVRSSFAFGLANVVVAGWALYLFRQSLPARRPLAVVVAASILLLGAGVVASDRVTTFAEERLYEDDVIFAKSSAYQRIVLTRWNSDIRLYLNGNLQFSSADEYRYHESLVHPALASLTGTVDALVLGGGDGMAARELLRDPRVRSVQLVDLDPVMTKIFSTHPDLVKLNGGSLISERMKVTNADAFEWLEKNEDSFDLVVVDLPDPTNFSLGKLYTRPFYRLIDRRLRPRGVMVAQATSPMFARESFWCINETIASSGFTTTPYHVYVPSFGEWGFVMASHGKFQPKDKFPEGLRFLNAKIYPSFFDFPVDMARVPSRPNRLDDQRLVSLHEKEWERITK